MRRAPSVGVVTVKSEYVCFALCMRAEMLRVVAQMGTPRESGRHYVGHQGLGMRTHAPLRLQLRR